jgi:hypothetical protein
MVAYLSIRPSVLLASASRTRLRILCHRPLPLPARRASAGSRPYPPPPPLQRARFDSGSGEAALGTVDLRRAGASVRPPFTPATRSCHVRGYFGASPQARTREPREARVFGFDRRQRLRRRSCFLFSRLVGKCFELVPELV